MGTTSRFALIIAGAVFLSGCEGGFDLDLRDMGNGFDTTGAARTATADRPVADDRGIISYPSYQIVVARRGDTVADIAARIGLGADELARHNGLTTNVALRENEVLALPRRVAEPSAATGAITSGPLTPGGVDITTLAGDAINRASSEPGHAPSAQAATGIEPLRHQVKRGETAYTIARLYDVSVRSLAEWNGLGSDLSVREGQMLVIPVVIDTPAETASSAPGAGSATPQPPSAATPLPSPEAPAPTPAPANLGGQDAGGKLAMPVQGSIIREYRKGSNDGIDISAPAGASVVAAGDGEVAAITRDTDQVPILVIRHSDNLLTVYAGVDKLSVKKGDRVTRGQKIAVIRDINPSFLHFEVRRGLDSVDPMDFLN